MPYNTGMQQHLFTIDTTLAGQRLDKALHSMLPSISRARLQELISTAQVTVNTLPITKPNYTTKTGDTIVLSVPPAIAATPMAQDLPLDIVFEDAAMLVINKAAGVVVHPAAGNADGTLVNALLAHCGESLSGINGVKRPGIVHRLDKETSGLMVVAKTDAAHQGLATQFADHSLSRTYSAVVHGIAPAAGTIETLIGRDPKNRQRMAVTNKNGKTAITHFKRQKIFGTQASLVDCVLETGRTHQIRVHMQHAGFPLVGDPLYGKKRGLKNLHPSLAVFPRQALHAAAISFKHPLSGKNMRFSSPLPDDMQQLLLGLEVPIL